jgi:NOL1/NOP2/fmu family ribosome biogenesis protein
MKLRIKGASLRLRLTQKEVRVLAEQGQVEEHVPFAAQTQLIYRLKRDAAVTQIQASFEHNVVEVRVPQALAAEWCAGKQVTLAHSQSLPQGALQITLEKDFACLAPRAEEDESDNFPHPAAGSGKTC